MKAIFSPGPSWSDAKVRQVAGWVIIMDLYKEALEELGFEVFSPSVDVKLLDLASSCSKIQSYDIQAADQLPEDADLFMGPPGYSVAQIIKLRALKRAKIMTFVWNNADWYRDQQVKPEYDKFGANYDMSPASRWLNVRALELSDIVLACSPWVKKTHAEVVPAEKIQIANWGVDSVLFHPPGVEPPGYRIAFVGSDPVRKGLQYLMSAMENINHEVELWIIGSRLFNIDKPKRFEANPKVVIREFGMVPKTQMPELLRQCHVVCIPTLEDGIALAIQEGMASGCVPVCSPETAEVFKDGVDGFSVPYRDPQALCARLSQLTDKELWRKMSANARAKAFSQPWSIVKDDLKRILTNEMEL